MKTRTVNLLTSVLCTAAAMAVFAAAGLASNERCIARWEHSGLASEWGPLKGCMVRIPDGRWIPADLLRQIELPEPTKPTAGRVTS